MWLHCMEITGIVIVGIFVFFVVFVVRKNVLQVFGQAVDILHLLEGRIINILLVYLCNKHGEVNVQKQKYGSE